MSRARAFRHPSGTRRRPNRNAQYLSEGRRRHVSLIDDMSGEVMLILHMTKADADAK